ncbi:MAG: DUF167 domain-containing protein [Patescibacteria group bacterium]|nr:DUF167 domain-containing protein [Patescibacteria group bacterium]
MTISCKVIPNAKQNKIAVLSDGCFKTYLTVPAVEGKANKALIKILADCFDVAKGKIQIMRGERGRNKIVRVQK